MSISGTVMGYDPGGNSNHGVAFFTFELGNIVKSSIHTLNTTNDVIELANKFDDLIAVGVDTLTCWSTGHSGWRPADRWLKQRYKSITNSIASANSLFGSMGLNGMSVLINLKEYRPDLHVSETHPKVLYYELTGAKYDYSNHMAMDKFLSTELQVPITTVTGHAYGAIPCSP